MSHSHQQSHTQQQQDHQNPTFLHDLLYCSEKHCEEEEEEITETSLRNNFNPNNQNPLPFFLEQDQSWENEELSCLFSKEKHQNIFPKILEANPFLAESRREAVEWMLKVNAHYNFSALTAVLAVNYLDRFLLNFQVQTRKPWMSQLAAVACLSLAAKVEETQVPLLLDLQVEDSKYVFEAKTIQRMEILVLSTLQWKMNPVNPLSFLDYITRRLGLKHHLCWEFLRRCERILLPVISDCRYMSYLPSVMATATMLLVTNSVEPCLGIEYQNQFLDILGVNKTNVDDCTKFILELTFGSHGKLQSNKRKFGSIPGSPNGIMDVSFSSDSSGDSWVAAPPPSVSSSPGPLSKKSRAQDQLLSINPR